MALYNSKTIVINSALSINTKTNTSIITQLLVPVHGRRYQIVYGGTTNSAYGQMTIEYDTSYGSETKTISVPQHSASSKLAIDIIDAVTEGYVTLYADDLGTNIWYKGFIALIQIE